MKKTQYDLNIFQPGVRVRKKSERPFKSTFQVNTIAGLVENPHSKKPAATFKEDPSVVDLRQLKPENAD